MARGPFERREQVWLLVCCFQGVGGIRDHCVTGVQTCALPIFALSQYGETIDVIEPLSRAKQKGSTIAALVNSLGSTIYRMADYKMLLGAGPEKAVASTKAFKIGRASCRERV